ncbi:aquaporin TIP4-1-like [Durio zibethinus]|uniref:Aquaporin TIP4-1-like n=1 Tax=Durio zibethinus TaxID=66656 RepID=A0A6P5ZU68_DURZI|nr:aquaporin TIP4-1-like [Durio zibethinus]
MPKISLGTSREAVQPDCIKALVVEFVTTFLFVFAGVGTSVAADEMGANTLVGLFVVAVAHALVVGAMTSAGRISGGHLNPAVTLGLLLGGHITVVRSILYCIDQLLASSAACILLKYLTGGLSIPIHSLKSGVGFLQGVLWEVILTFSLLFTVYAIVVDPKKGSIDGLGPMLIGFVVGANILAGGAFSGASMNPARSFGPAFVSWDWTDHWVYWVGPLIGGGLAGYIYEKFFIVKTYASLPHEDEAF